MHAALSFNSITLCYAAGIHGCSAAITVVRALDLDVHAHEVVGICGGAAAGKSTLLLCAAGLLRPAAGGVRWFGRSRLAGGAHSRVVFVRAGADAARCTLALPFFDEPGVLVLDDPFRDIGGPEYTRVADRIDAARRRGDAVLVTAREPTPLHSLATRVLTLRDGRVHAADDHSPARQARVAERAKFG